jgi:hypothetical protein
MNNRLIKIQEMLFNQMERLDNNDLMEKGLGKREIQRSGALSQSAASYIKSVQTQLKIMEMTKGRSQDDLLEQLGVLSND